MSNLSTSEVESSAIIIERKDEPFHLRGGTDTPPLVLFHILILDVAEFFTEKFDEVIC
jgi:hypothetical protein